MTIKFTKMHGLGNDFMVIDGINQKIQLNKEQIALLSNRHTGIGFDQCLLIEAPKNDSHDFFYRIFNGNGEEVGQCGNGARCLALFAKHYQLIQKNSMRIATKTTQMELEVNADGTVSVKMDKPQLNPAKIPFLSDQQSETYPLSLPDGEQWLIHALNVGNPHSVTRVDDIDTAPVDTVGKVISTHAAFPEQTNAGFMQILSSHHMKLRVYERGCGETLACGSGAVAAAVAGRLFHHMDETITVSLPGGDLEIYWPSMESDITLTGPGSFVYEGRMLF